MALSKEEQKELQLIILKLERINQENSIRDWFTEDGPLSYKNYRKHFRFWELGQTEVERCFLAANRVGKTVAGGYEMAMHLTGLYPDWWPGYRFPYTIKAWAAGDTNDTVRDIIQPVLFGPKGSLGTGMIPFASIEDITYKRGSNDVVDNARIRKVGETEKFSILQLKSYEQGRKTFQGTRMDVIWLDEEPSMDIYSECQIRTMRTDETRAAGQLMCTFTPLLGMSDVCLHFLPGGRLPPEMDQFL